MEKHRNNLQYFKEKNYKLKFLSKINKKIFEKKNTKKKIEKLKKKKSNLKKKKHTINYCCNLQYIICEKTVILYYLDACIMMACLNLYLEPSLIMSH